jgi:hypothetical protein
MAKKKQKKVKVKKHQSGVEERMKSIANIELPDENPFKKDNEDKIDHWRPAFRNDRQSYKEKSRLSKRKNRPRRSQKKKLF